MRPAAGGREEEAGPDRKGLTSQSASFMLAAAAAAASAAEPGAVGLPVGAEVGPAVGGVGVFTGSTFDIHAAFADDCGDGPFPRSANVSR